MLLENISTATTGRDLFIQARKAYGWSDDDEVKLLYRGKKLKDDDAAVVFTFTDPPKKTPKIIVMVTSSATVSKVSQQTSDPLIRGLDEELQRDHNKQQQQALSSSSTLFWGPNSGQDRNYKFCKFEACTWQSFGHRSIDSTPHAFAARRLLERLATDPGIVAIMKERELVVNTLGEMDPIDDRLMQKKQQESNGHACLLGYNTNRGLRIDLKLRTEDLSGFRPYTELVSTLIHELSHNWVSEHDLLFFLNYAQMRAEYMYHHAHHTDNIVNGSTTASLAGFGGLTPQHIFPTIMEELRRDMAQYGVQPNMIQEGILQRCRELDDVYTKSTFKQRRLGGGGDDGGASASKSTSRAGSARERALAAAERRRQQQKE